MRVGTGQTVRLGTRGSALALKQAEIVAAALLDAHPELQVETVVVRTEGDRVQDRPLTAVGDKGVFVRGIEARLLDSTIDLAVHSLKDVPSDVSVPGLELVAFSRREDPHDVLVSRNGERLADLPPGGRIGTGSVRRRVQLLALRPDLVVLDIRGNVDTRLRKLRDGQYDAIILAAAGLIRLDLGQVITEYLPYDRFTPDAGQGIVAVQGRVGDPISDLAGAIDIRNSRLAADAERSVVRALGAGCHSPVGALAQIEEDRLFLRAMAAPGTNGPVERETVEGRATEAAYLGERAGLALLARIGSYTEP